MKIDMFIQARINSVRLPNKALKIIKEKPAIFFTLQSMKKVKCVDYVILTNDVSYYALKDIAIENDYKIFVGDDENVLKRFCDCIDTYKSDYIIRATGDNLLLSYEYANKSIELLSKNPNMDYITYTNLPIGCGVELVRCDALKKALSQTQERYNLEHVCPYLYNNPDKFNILKVKSDDRHAKFFDRLVTMDTQNDYEKINKIFNDLYKGDVIGIDLLCEYLEKQNI